jgi:hypothetical protein
MADQVSTCQFTPVTPLRQQGGRPRGQLSVALVLEPWRNMGVEGLRQIVRGSLAGDQRQLAGSRQ